MRSTRLLLWLVLLTRPTAAIDPTVLAAEQARIAIIEKVKPSVVAVCFYGGQACGSGVLIDPDGYALTNYHVIEPTGPIMQCGLPDGQLYDAVLVGQDRVGDLALIKLLPNQPGQPFPFATMTDSDSVRVGDWSLAMGNPFGLATDFTPTVTFGLVSGVHRYQPPEGKGTLEYTDCIQVDTSINPGNSGGPLFNMAGELIGINGRIMFEKRVRINSGIGFAISSNQVKNFLGHLRAGHDVDHATLGAIVETENEDGDLARMIVRQVLEDSDVARRGLQPGDQLIAFAGRPMTSTNQFKNVLGIYPKDWRLPLTFRRGTERKDILVRLMGSLDQETEDAPPAERRPKPTKKPDPNQARAKASPASKLYQEKKGFANYYFNRLERDRLLSAFRQHGDYTGLTGSWTIRGMIELIDRKGEVTVTLRDGPDELAEISILRAGGIEDKLIPLKEGVPLGELQLPQGSGGLLLALYQYHRLLTLGPEGFEGGVIHGGYEPFYPPQSTGQFTDWRVECDVLRTKHAAFDTKWYFRRSDQLLLGCEAFTAPDEDPCELYFSDYRLTEQRRFPHRIDIRYGDKQYGVLTVTDTIFGKK